RDPHALTGYFGAGLAPELEGGFVAKLDADLFQDRHRLLMQQLDAFGADQLVKRNLPRDVALLDQGSAGALGAPACRAAASRLLGGLCRHSGTLSPLSHGVHQGAAVTPPSAELQP